jgi:4-amino-4-deoxychorismate lyase
MPRTDSMRGVERHDERFVVAILGKGVVPADTPFLRADDLGVLRGDGIFETMHLRGGKPWLCAEHLARMERSAALLELALPPRPALEELAAQAYDGWPAEVEGALRLVCTRGPEHGDGSPTVFATLAEIAPARRAARRDGVSVATATLGYSIGVRSAAPWLLGGAKTLSYAVNMASMRWGSERGADEVLWVSADGYALEAPTASLVWLDGDELCTVPPERAGILPGTTARWLLDHAGDLGFKAAERLIRPEELGRTDGAWFTSSVRGSVAIKSLDGVAFDPSPHTPRLLELMGFDLQPH